MGKTDIEWTDETWNPVTGCTKVSQGCKHCYAERVFPRAYAHAKMPDGHGGMRIRNFTDVRCHPERLEQPLHWREPRRVFVNSMSDLFHEDVPDDFIAQIFEVMVALPRHQFQILTKRPERMRAFMNGTGWPRRRGINNDLAPNIWLGVSVEDQITADERIPLLLQTPAAVRFVSYEPALGPVDFSQLLPGPVNSWFTWLDELDWIIAGGESGPNARPAHPDWFRSVRDQCQAAGVAFFFKQWGEWLSHLDVPSAYADTYSYRTRGSRNPSAVVGDELMVRVGKKAAGRELDGRIWNQMPRSG